MALLYFTLLNQCTLLLDCQHALLFLIIIHSEVYTYFKNVILFFLFVTSHACNIKSLLRLLITIIYIIFFFFYG